MATSSYCGTHDIRYRGSECPRCVADNRHEESLRQQRDAAERQRELLDDASYRNFNPGQYDCPHCLFRTLKYLAPKCPICHGAIDGEYWAQVQKREKEAAILSAKIKAEKEKELERTRPERERVAREQEQKKAQQGRLKEFDKRGLKVFLVFFSIYFVIFIPGVVVYVVGESVKSVGVTGKLPLGLMFIPFINWVILLAKGIWGGQYGNMLFNRVELCLQFGAAVVVIGLLIFLGLRQRVKSGK